MSFDDINVPDLTGIEDAFNISHLVDQGFIRIGFNPYVTLFGDFFWGLFFGIIGIAIYNWKNSSYHLIGYLVAILVFTRVILPIALADFFAIILGFAVSGLIYKVFITKRKDKEAK